MPRKKLGEIIYDEDTGEAKLVWDKLFQPVAPIDLAMWILLCDALVDVSADIETKYAHLKDMVVIEGMERVQ